MRRALTLPNARVHTEFLSTTATADAVSDSSGGPRQYMLKSSSSAGRQLRHEACRQEGAMTRCHHIWTGCSSLGTVVLKAARRDCASLTGSLLRCLVRLSDRVP